MGMAATPKSCRDKSITRPMLPMAGELSKVEQTL